MDKKDRRVYSLKWIDKARPKTNIDDRVSTLIHTYLPF